MTSEPTKSENLLEAPLLVFGAGGHGKVVLDALECMEQRPEAIVDDSPQGASFCGYPLVKNSGELWARYPAFRFHVAVGHNEARKQIFLTLQHRGGVPFSIIHPRVVISRHAEVGEGNFIAAGAILNPGARTGANCIINTGAVVDHDCEIGDHCHVCPGVRLAGNVKIGTQVMVGTGSSVIPGLTVGAGSMIGAGSVVVRPIPPRSVAMGVPARVTRQSAAE